MKRLILILLLAPAVASASDGEKAAGAGAVGAGVVATAALLHGRQKRRRDRASRAVLRAYPNLSEDHLEREVKNLLRPGGALKPRRRAR